MFSENENESYQSPSGNTDQRFKDIRAYATRVMIMTYTFDRRYIHIVKVSFRYIQRKFTILKIEQIPSCLLYHSLLTITVRSSLNPIQARGVPPKGFCL